MGYRTPNIDRIAKEGCIFTDWYGQQSCTAGRAAFITGQSPIRTGLTKVGLPGAEARPRPEDPTIAELLKPLGYVTGQFGKNHLGDRDELPADRARFRRVLRQSLSPERRAGAGEPRLPEESRSSRRVRAARRAPQLGQRRRHAEDRGHRPADQKAHGNGGRGVPRRQPEVHREGGQGREAVLLLVECHARCTSSRT